MTASPTTKASPWEGKYQFSLSGETPQMQCRSTSATSSERSLITVVEDDSGLPTLNCLETDWCIADTKEMATEQTSLESGQDISHPILPWILPVYVISTYKNDQKDFEPKQGQCTFDTGNDQGNIVSRNFLLKVLGYSEASFLPLTEEEKNGGTGITGHRFTPEGAICLSWYHNRSTRLFRDMRFLVSPHPHYDLIIGARSIKEHDILGKPNLMVLPNKVLPKASTEAKELERLRTIVNSLKKEVGRLEFIIEIQRQNNKEVSELQKSLSSEQHALELARNDYARAQEKHAQTSKR